MLECEEIRRARAFLLRAVEPPAVDTFQLVADVGPVDAARLIETGDVSPEVTSECRPVVTRRQAADDLAFAREHGFRLVVPEDAEWPALEGHADVVPPLGLWVRGAGSLRELTSRSVSVVGSRAATAYGDQIAADLAYELGRENVVVWSGAAYGIDAAAHRGALAADAPTVAVLPCGLAVDYPLAHHALLQRIAAAGAVVSEYPVHAPPSRRRFLARNRLLALLTRGVVVPEASHRSGAKNTASAAWQLGRPVCAVPGPVTSVASAGCHELIQQGAELVTNAAQVQEVLALDLE